MNNLLIYLFTTFTLLSLFGCQENKEVNQSISNKSYINEFELVQGNTNNDNIIKITSRKAIFDLINKNIEILNSSIEILNKKGKELNIKSGKSTLNNTEKIIRVFDEVNISFFDTKDYYINTNSFEWDLNSSIIVLDSLLNVYFDNTKIISSNGTYDISSNMLILYNNKFTSSIISNNVDQKYNIEIRSDIAKWAKKDNVLEFTSNKKQVETKVNFLTFK